MVVNVALPVVSIQATKHTLFAIVADSIIKPFTVCSGHVLASKSKNSTSSCIAAKHYHSHQHNTSQRYPNSMRKCAFNRQKWNIDTGGCPPPPVLWLQHTLQAGVHYANSKGKELTAMSNQRKEATRCCLVKC